MDLQSLYYMYLNVFYYFLQSFRYMQLNASYILIHSFCYMQLEFFYRLHAIGNSVVLRGLLYGFDTGCKAIVSPVSEIPIPSPVGFHNKSRNTWSIVGPMIKGSKH
jgi:hypothetical protein